MADLKKDTREEENVQDEESEDGRQRSSKKFESSTRKSGTAAGTGNNALFASIQTGDLSSVKGAVKAGANVNTFDDFGWTPLRKSARIGNMDIVAYLLAQNADVTANDSSVLVTAASWGRTDVLQHLIDHKGQVNDIEWELSPLVVAAQNGHLGIIKILIEQAGMNVNQPDTKGNDALMTAWNFGRSGIVRYLVENGAHLKKREDWEYLAQSPATALNIADGTAAHIEKLRKMVEMGEIKSSDIAKLEVPLTALCAWIRMVPHAALILLDKVLLTQPDEAPTRATMDMRKTMNTVYVNVCDWLPKEEPLLLTLAPKDLGGGSNVSVCSMQQKGILTTQVFFSLASANARIFRSLVVTAMLEHAWTGIIETRVRFNIAFEILLLVALITWSTVSKEDGVRYIGVAFTVLAIILDFGEEMRQLSFHSRFHERYFKNIFSNAGASIFRWFRILASLILVAMIVETEVRETKVEHDYAEYKIALSILAVARWARLLGLVHGYAWIGPYILPIIRCTKNLVYWGLVALTFLFASAHCTGVLALENANIEDILLSRFGIITLQSYEPITMFSRAEHWAEDSDITNPELTDGVLFFFQSVWFIILSFVCGIALFNVLIAVISDSYDIEQQRSWYTFLQERTDIAFTYFLSIERYSMSPIELFMDKVLHAEKPNPNKYLWLCTVVDEETNMCNSLDRYLRSGRLGELSSFVEETVGGKYSELCERLDNFEESLQKKIQTFNSLLKTTKKELMQHL